MKFGFNLENPFEDNKDNIWFIKLYLKRFMEVVKKCYFIMTFYPIKGKGWMYFWRTKNKKGQGFKKNE